MSSPSVILELEHEKNDEPRIETRATLGHLCELRDQIKSTAEWGRPCLNLEIEKNTYLVGRAAASRGEADYDIISAGFLGPNFTPKREGYETVVSAILSLDERQMNEVAALNHCHPPGDSYYWTTVVPEDAAKQIIGQIERTETRIID